MPLATATYERCILTEDVCIMDLEGTIYPSIFEDEVTLSFVKDKPVQFEKWLQDIYHEDQEQFRDFKYRSLGKKEKCSFEYRLDRNDSVEWYYTSLTAIYDKNKKINQYRCVSQSIDQLKKNERSYYYSLNAIKEGVSIIDKEGSHKFVNPAFCKMLGLSKSELIDQPATTYWAEENSDYIQSKLTETLEGNEGVYEFIFKHKNEKRIPVRLTVAKIDAEKGVDHKYLGVVEDISQELVIEARKLRKSRMKQCMVEISKKSLSADNPITYLEKCASSLSDFFDNYPHEGFELSYSKNAFKIKGKSGNSTLVEKRTVIGKTLLLSFSLEKDNIKAEETDFIVSIINQMVGVFHKLHYQKQLASNERKLRLLYENMEQGVVFQNENGEVTSANTAACQILGLSYDELVGVKSIDPRWRALHEDFTELPGEQHPSMITLKTGKPVKDKIMAVYNPGQDNYTWIKVNSKLINSDEDSTSDRVFTTFDDFTTLKNQADQLRINEEKYRFLFYNQKDLVCLHDAEGHYLEVSPSIKEILGYNTTELIGKNPYELFHPDDIKLIREKSHKPALKNNPPDRIHYRIKCKDGNYKWLETMTSVYTSQNEVKILTTSRDIDEQYENERFMNLLVDIYPQIIMVYDFKNRKINYLGKAFEKITGYKIGQTIGQKGFLDDKLLYPESDDKKGELFSKIEKLKEDELLNENVRITTASNEEKILKFHITLFNANRQSHPNKVLIIGADITNEIEFEQQLKRSEFFLDKAQSISEVGSWVVNGASGKIEYVSNNCGGIFNVKKTYFTHDSVKERLYKPDILIFQDIEKAIQSKKKIDVNKKLVLNSKGKNKVIEFLFLSEQPGEDNTLRYYGIVKNITEHAAQQKELNNTLKQLKQTNAELTEFAYIASHDFQEPLRMISSFLRLIESKLTNQLDEQIRSYIEIVSTNAVKLQIMVNDLLKYSRVNTIEKNSEHVDLNEILKEVQLTLHEKISKNNVQIKYRRLPKVKGIKSLLSSLFINIIDNAIKYRSELDPIIEISSKNSQTHWTFSIKDNGIGMNEKYSDKVFKIFQRLHRNDKIEGTGIGLSVVKRIVNKHGGEIWFKKNIDKGITIFLTLPKKN